MRYRVGDIVVYEHQSFNGKRAGRIIAVRDGQYIVDSCSFPIDEHQISSLLYRSDSV